MKTFWMLLQWSISTVWILSRLPKMKCFLFSKVKMRVYSLMITYFMLNVANGFGFSYSNLCKRMPIVSTNTMYKDLEIRKENLESHQHIYLKFIVRGKVYFSSITIRGPITYTIHTYATNEKDPNDTLVILVGRFNKENKEEMWVVWQKMDDTIANRPNFNIYKQNTPILKQNYQNWKFALDISMILETANFAQCTLQFFLFTMHELKICQI